MITIEINAQRLTQELAQLATYSDAELPAVTRIVFSDADMRARAYIRELCAAAGLVMREDAVGNLFARWEGRDLGAPAIGTGSHIDAIPHSGQFDGTVGVLGGIEAIRALQAAGFRPRRSIELLLFTSEEPTRFGIGCLGSRLLAGTLDAEADERLKDDAGQTLREVRQSAGFSGGLESVRLGREYYHAFVELHIEQGPLLERSGDRAGIVTAIAAPATLRVTLRGEGGHAGAVLMPERKDALAAAAEIILQVERAAKGTGAIDTVATVGVCKVFPGAVNGIPSSVTLEIDIRDISEERRDGVLTEVSQAVASVSERRGISYELLTLNADAPATSSPEVVAALEEACRLAGIEGKRMISRAYHDSLFMARIAPVAMLFIPCRAGVSHRPDEFASTVDIAAGTKILALALAALSA